MLESLTVVMQVTALFRGTIQNNVDLILGTEKEFCYGIVKRSKPKSCVARFSVLTQMFASSKWPSNTKEAKQKVSRPDYYTNDT